MPLRVTTYLFITILLSTVNAVSGQAVRYLTNEPVTVVTPVAEAEGILKVVIANPYPNDERYRLSLSQPIFYQLISDGREGKKTLVTPITFAGNATLTLYLKPDLHKIKPYGYAIHPDVKLEKEIVASHRDSIRWISWIISISLLACFAAYSLYIYFQLRDRLYLWYLTIELGAALYITSYKHFVTFVLPPQWRQIRVTPAGVIYSYDLNSFFLHMGGTTVLISLLQLTRSFLRTKELMPGYDTWLRYTIITYIAYAVIPGVITLSGWFYLDNYTLLYDNIFVLLIGLSILVTSAVAYKKKVRAAGAYMIAITLPIILAAGLACYYIIRATPDYSDNNSVLPEIAIISQIITFTIVLVTRIRTINEELDAKSYDIARLETDIAQSKHHRWLIEKENEQINKAMQAEMNRNDLLQQKLDVNNRELVSNSLYIHQKNKLLDDLKKQLHDIDELYPNIKHPGIKSIKTSLRDHQFLDAEWDKFRLHFEQVHPGFFEKLKVKHPNLTNNELRLYAYFHINLSTKEIATLLNIEAASVRQAKARLNKKLKISD
jgi:hypothetical protein